MTAPKPKRYCPICERDYAATPVHWALFSRRFYDRHTGAIIWDEKTGQPKEEMRYVCIVCVNIRFYEERLESIRLKKAIKKKQCAA